MALLRMQVAINGNTVEPRDRLVNVLHFNRGPDFGIGTGDVDTLCADLGAIYQNGWLTSPGARGIRVTAYEVGPPPNYPVGHWEANPQLAGFGDAPAEIALCLSFYAERNLPRQRGRIYLPAHITSGTKGAVPQDTMRNAALDLADDFANLGGVNVDWVVYSPTDDVGRPVSMAWVDNAWDTQRRRGPRATGRLSRAIGE